MDVSEIAVWLAVGGSALALGKQVYDIWHKRHTEKVAIQDALDKQPLVREQLELGNVGEAVKVLNVIIEQQAGHLTRLIADHARERAEDQREREGLERELDDVRRRLRACEERTG